MLSVQTLQACFQIGRYHIPVGIWLLFWPSLWGLVMGCQGVPRSRDVLLFVVGSILVRGAGCTINDIWDHKFDAQVQRTSQRPLVTGSLSLKMAWIFLFLQLGAALGVLLQLPTPAIYAGFLGLFLLSTYPLLKRWTYWPQIYLGFAMNLGLLIGFAASLAPMRPGPFVLYLAGIFWTLGYDTIYALQDLEDDRRIGVKSTAVLLGGNSYYLVALCYALMSVLLVWVALFENLSPVYFVALSMVGAHLIWQLTYLKKHPKNIRLIFLSNPWVGGLIAVGLLGGYLWR